MRHTTGDSCGFGFLPGRMALNKTQTPARIVSVSDRAGFRRPKLTDAPPIFPDVSWPLAASDMDLLLPLAQTRTPIKRLPMQALAASPGIPVGAMVDAVA